MRLAAPSTKDQPRNTCGSDGPLLPPTPNRASELARELCPTAAARKCACAWRALAKRALVKQDFRPDFLDAITRGLPHLLRCVEVVRGGEEPGEEAHRDGDVLQEVDLRLGVEVLLDEERV